MRSATGSLIGNEMIGPALVEWLHQLNDTTRRRALERRDKLILIVASALTLLMLLVSSVNTLAAIRRAHRFSRHPAAYGLPGHIEPWAVPLVVGGTALVVLTVAATLVSIARGEIARAKWMNVVTLTVMVLLFVNIYAVSQAYPDATPGPSDFSREVDTAGWALCAASLFPAIYGGYFFFLPWMRE